MNLPDHIMAPLTALLHPEQRAAAALQLAQHLGGHELLLFLTDPVLDLPLPAPGFPQTLPDGRMWKAFVRLCIDQGSATGVLCAPGSGGPAPASGVARDGGVLIVLGLEQPSPELLQLAALLPFLTAALRGEQEAQLAAGQVAVAQEAVAHANALAATLDTTRQKLQQAFNQAAEALQTRDAFLLLAAHELKTPVATLMGYIQLTQRRFAKSYNLSPRDAQTLQAILEQVRRLNRLIASLFDLSRIQMGRFSLDYQSVDIVALIRQTVEELRPNLEHHSLNFVAYQSSLPICGDPVRLEQIFYNLLFNAIKYSPDKGQITVNVSEEKGEACIRVSDEGIGIPTEALPYLFTQFYRAENARAFGISGLGVGLYVVKEIIAAHKGHIEVTSREGEGTTFTIYLPLIGALNASKEESHEACS